MNKYKAFYRNKSIDIEADTSYHAQLKAAEMFKAKKSYEVTVVLCERSDGSTVVHNGSEL